MFNYILSFIQMLYLNEQDGRIRVNLPYSTIATYLLVSMCIIVVLIYVFKSVAIYLMCKNNQVENAYLAFVPFANYVLIGKLTGKVKMFSWSFKNIGVWTAILLALTFVSTAFFDILACNDEFRILVTQNVVSETITYADTAFFAFLKAFSTVSLYITLFFVVWMSFSFLSKYNRQNAFWISLLLTLLFGEMFYLIFNLIFAIVIFCCRKNKPFDIQEYYRRQQAYQMGNFNQNTASNSNAGNLQKNEDPFEEFATEKKTGLEQDIFPDFSPSSDYTERNNQLKNDEKNETDNSNDN